MGGEAYHPAAVHEPWYILQHRQPGVRHRQNSARSNCAEPPHVRAPFLESLEGHSVPTQDHVLKPSVKSLYLGVKSLAGLIEQGSLLPLAPSGEAAAELPPFL